MQLTKTHVENYLDQPSDLDFNSVTKLDPDAAETLAENWSLVFPEQPLRLNGLKLLDPETAYGLSLFHSGTASGWAHSVLELNGLTELNEETAEALIWNGSVLNNRRIKLLRLDGLREISPTVASILALTREGLSLGALQEISPDVANHLITIDSLFLDGLRVLTPEVAAVFVSRADFHENGQQISMNGLKSISQESLKAMEGFNAYPEYHQTMILNGINNLEIPLISGLSRSGIKTIRLNGINHLPQDVWEQFIQFPYALEMNGVRTFDYPNGLCTEGSNLKTLSLNGMEGLNKGQATFLAGLDLDEINLAGVSGLSDRAFELLVGSSAGLNLLGLTEINPGQAAEWAQSQTEKTRFIGVQSMKWDVCKSLGKTVRHFATSQLTSLTPKVARRLGRIPEGTDLEGLARLSPRVAFELSKARGKVNLSGLKNISQKIAGILAETKSDLVLGLEKINPKVAAALANYRGERLTLGKFSSIEPDVAKAFKFFPGILEFEIRHLDQKTAAILAACDGDIRITFRGRVDHLESFWIRDLANNQCIIPTLGLSTVDKEIQEDSFSLEFCDYLRITPEAAQKLGNKRVDSHVCLELVNRISESTADSLGKLNGAINLFGMRKIPPLILERLVGNGVGLRLMMDWLDEPSAEILSRHNGSVEFWGLRSLTTRSAQLLAKSKASFSFPDLCEIPDDVAVELSAHKHALSFGNLLNITLFGAKMLARDGDKTKVNFQTQTNCTLSEGAIWLACNSDEFDCNWYKISELPDSPIHEYFTEKIIGTDNEELNFSRLRAVGPRCAKILARFNGPIQLRLLEVLHPDTASGFCTHRGTLLLNNLKVLEADSAKELALHRHGEISLNGLVNLDQECALALSQLKNTLRLDGLKEISDEVAEALARHSRGGLSLNGLERISDKAAHFLGNKKGVWLRLGNARRISARALEYLKHFKGQIKLPKFRDPE